MEKLNDEPIFCYEDGKIVYKSYYKDGSLHNENGPAYIQYDEDGNITIMSYIINGLYHNIQGPAVNYYYKSGNIQRYFINGERINSKEEFEIIVKHLAIS